MFRLMEKARNRNNKGFSLVELIVVVLIIAIIAVALAPQVVKYVGKARTNVTENTKGTITSSVQAAVAEYQSQKDVATLQATTYTIAAKQPASGSRVSGGDNKNVAPTNGSSLADLIAANIGKDDLDYSYTVEVGADATVTTSKVNPS